jgi:hypothetical protein
LLDTLDEGLSAEAGVVKNSLAFDGQRFMIRQSVWRRVPRCHREEPMLQIPRPTPTCTRFETTIEMPCMKCATEMRLALVEPRDPNFDLLTYRCIACDSDEVFLSRSRA